MNDLSSPRQPTEITPLVNSSSRVAGYVEGAGRVSNEPRQRTSIPFQSHVEGVNACLNSRLNSIERNNHSNNKSPLFRLGVVCIGEEMDLMDWERHVQKTRSGAYTLFPTNEDLLYVRLSASDVVLPSARPRHSLFSSLHKAYTPVKPANGNGSVLSIQYDTEMANSDDLSESEYALSKVAHLFCFKAGLIVSWGINSAQQDVLLEETGPFVRSKVLNKERTQADCFGYLYADNKEKASKEPLWSQGRVQLQSNSDSIEEMLAISYALAQRNLYANFDLFSAQFLYESNPTRRKIAGSGSFSSLKLNQTKVHEHLLKLQSIRTAIRAHEWTDAAALDSYPLNTGSFGVPPRIVSHLPTYFLSRPYEEEAIFLQTQIYLGTYFAAASLKARIEVLSETIGIFVHEFHIHRLERLLWIAFVLVVLCAVFVFLSVFYYPKF